MSELVIKEFDANTKLAMYGDKHTREILSNLIPDEPKLPFSTHCKVYNDGSHFVAVEKIKTYKHRKTNTEFVEEKRFFDELYIYYLMQGKKHNQLFPLLKETIAFHFPELECIDEFVTKNIKRARHNYFSRIKRLKRKANLNVWNKWVTITYDPKKHTATTFKTKLRKCLSNLHSRRKWNYMGVFELAPETNRLHFHALMYIPPNEMIGEIKEITDYSTAQHKMQTTHSNTFFAETFGRNDFEDITKEDIKNGTTIEYLTKYISKTNEKIIYSRGIPSELDLFVEDQDIASKYVDYCVKYVLFDDCFDLYANYSPFKHKPNIYKQSNFFDLLPCQSG